jgi:HSP20 family molecular chaperone IbpA
MRFLLKERKLGPWMRSFTLPVNADMKALRVRLDAGLLRICVLKKAVVA